MKHNLLEEDIEPHIRDLQTSPGIFVTEHRKRTLWNQMDGSSTMDDESMDSIIGRFVHQICPDARHPIYYDLLSLVGLKT